MILHRLLLENFRGVQREEVEFPDRGVVVVEGPNESGKTSLVDALEMLLLHKATSQRADVKAACPVGRQVPVVVEAEFTVDARRMIYRKQFVNDRRTSLQFCDTTRPALSGDDAHDHVTALLADTVDRSLWQALRIVQDEPIAQVGVTEGMDSLRRALDAAAGGTDPGGDDALIGRVEAEKNRYFTARKGDPTGELARSEARLAGARERLASARTALAELDRAVDRHTAATAALAGTTEAVRQVTDQVRDLEGCQERLDTLRTGVRDAGVELDRAGAELDAIRAADIERRTLVADVEGVRARVEKLAGELVGVADRERTARLRSDEASRALVDAEQRVDSARRTLDLARARREARRDRRELRAVQRTLDLLEEVDRRITEVREELRTAEVDPDLVERLREAAEAERQAAARRSAQAPVVELLGRGSVRVGKQQVEAENGWREEILESTRFQIDDLAVIVHPAGGSEAVRREYDSAHATTLELLEQLGVSDQAEAEERQRRTTALGAELDSLRRRRTDLLGDDTAQELSARAERLRATLGDTAHGAAGDRPEDRSESEGDDDQQDVEHEARETYAAAESALVAARAAEREAAEVLSRVIAEAAACGEGHRAATDEAQRLQDRLFAARGERADEVLASRLQEASETEADARRRMEAARGELEQAMAEAPPGDLDNARAALADLTAELDTARDEVAEAKGVVTDIGDRGLLEEVAEADRELADAERENAALWRRARAARLLARVLHERRSEALAAYQAPFHRAVVELGRLVYERDFDVELDEDLTILARRDAGVTVPYDSLSGGAREQLAVIVRIACARLVGVDGVPVFLDDTMGNTDPSRRLSMGGVLAAAAGTSQLVVLTCDRARFAGIGGARTHTMGRCHTGQEVTSDGT